MNRQKIRELAESFRDEVVELRHHFHRNPETGWKELETSNRIESLLRGWGIREIRRGFRGTNCGVRCGLPGRRKKYLNREQREDSE